MGVGGAWILFAFSYQSQMAPQACRWCDAFGGQLTLNRIDARVRSALKWDDTAHANSLGHYTAFLVTPVLAFGLTGIASAHDGRGGGWAADVFVIGESTLVAADLNQLVKLIVGRQRPSVHFAAPPGAWNEEDNLSFFSGDTNCAFALATSAGTVASIRGYRLAPVIWAVGMTFAVTTGYLRLAADRHYFTDVLAGATLGSLVGFAVPFLLHRGDNPPTGDAMNAPPLVSYSGSF